MQSCLVLVNLTKQSSLADQLNHATTCDKVMVNVQHATTKAATSFIAGCETCGRKTMKPFCHLLLLGVSNALDSAD
jgi:hypothetical protein